MSEQSLLEPPFTLTSLAAPFDAVSGKTHASPVFALRGQAWRKRPEVAVAVDGESITIYNIRNPRLVTSYALPPQTRCLADPCSVYRKVAGQKSAQRITYAAITAGSGNKNEVACFVEESLSETSNLSSDQQVKAVYPLQAANADILAIHTLGSHSDHKELAAALDVCVVYSNGAVECIAGDLSSQRWHAESPQALATSSTSMSFGPVQYTTCTDAASARKGLLKGREDALALIGASLDINTPLLVFITASQAQATESEAASLLHIFALPSRSKDLSTGMHHGLRHILTYPLPLGPAYAASSAKSHFSLHPSSGKLHRLEGSGAITTYDLSGTTPQVMSRLTSPNRAYNAFLRISPALLLAANSTSCGVYDVKYSSLQALCPLEADSLEPAGNKRKRSPEQSLESTLDFVSFFSEIGLAVAVTSNSLVGFQINPSASLPKKSKANTSLLINSLGKGTGRAREAFQDQAAKSISDEKWLKWKTSVDHFITDSDFTSLEKFVATDLGLAEFKKKTRRGRHNKDRHGLKKLDKPDTALTNGDAEESVETDSATKATIDGEGKKSSQRHSKDVSAPTQSTPKTNSKESEPRAWDFHDVSLFVRKTNRRKALYILGKMFTREAEENQEALSVSLAFFVPNIFKWLALTGYMSAVMIERAHSQLDVIQPGSLKVRPGAIMTAICEFDPEMHIMHELLNLSVHLDIEEVVASLRLLLESLEPEKTEPEKSSSDMLITSGEADEEPSANNDPDGTFKFESEAAEADFDYALSLYENGIPVRSASFHKVFIRLHSFPSTTVVNALRTLLTPFQIFDVLQLLRRELQQGGWTVRYLDGDVQDADESGGPAEGSIAIITDLANCTIDAIGVSGWLVGLSSDVKRNCDEMLALLRAEVSATLEGCHQAYSLSLSLNNFDKYCSLLRETQSKTPVKKVDPIKAPGFEEAPQLVDPVLPMGFKVPEVAYGPQTAASKMIMRSGGREQKKSKSLLGKEQSMRVGKYSLDRIRV